MEDVLTLLKERKTDELINSITKQEELIHFKDVNGTSLLLLSIYYGNKELKDYLITRKKEFTIFEASASGMLSEVERILKKDPQQINAFAPDGFTPLGLAAFFSHEPVAEFLLRAGAIAKQASNNPLKVAPIHSAAAAKNIAIAKLLLDHGAEVNAKQQEGFTPLHSAAHNGDKPMAELLLRYGADRDAKADSGKTPYDLALERNHTEIIKLLT